MKTIILYLFLIGIGQPLLCQNLVATFGKKPTCNRHGGICSLSNEKSLPDQQFNAAFFKNENNQIVLRIYRDKLSLDETQYLLSSNISEENGTAIKLQQDSNLPLSPKTLELLPANSRVTSLQAKRYPVKISAAYIDITLNE